MIEDNKFAAACFNENSTDELIDALLQEKADKYDLETWKISPVQWRLDIAEALRAKISVLKDSQCTRGVR